MRNTINVGKSIRGSKHHIALRGVKDGLVMMPSNVYALPLSVSSLNFELKSENEQDIIVDAYQNFLNSLNIDIQILVRVREVDVDAYLERFRKQVNNEPDAIYRNQLRSYVEFLEKLVDSSNILTRYFYLLIPYKSDSIEIAKEQLSISADIVKKGLARLGLHVEELDDAEILALFGDFFLGTKQKHPLLTGEGINMLRRSYL